jgi:hypothetical protein
MRPVGAPYAKATVELATMAPAAPSRTARDWASSSAGCVMCSAMLPVLPAGQASASAQTRA